MWKKGMVIVKGVLSNQLYILKTDATIQKRHSAHVSALQLCHERPVHVHTKNVFKMARKGSAGGINSYSETCVGVCNGCVAGKAHQEPVQEKRRTPRTKNLSHLVHSYVCGTMKVSYLGGLQYFVTFIDDFSNWVTLSAIKHKLETEKFYPLYEKMAERQTEKKIWRIRLDRGGEYLSDVIQFHFAENRIQHQHSFIYVSSKWGCRGTE